MTTLRALLPLVSLSLVVACSSASSSSGSSPSSGADAGDDGGTSLAPPAAGHGIQLTMETTIAGSTEDERCKFVQTTEDLWVNSEQSPVHPRQPPLPALPHAVHVDPDGGRPRQHPRHVGRLRVPRRRARRVLQRGSRPGRRAVARRASGHRRSAEQRRGAHPGRLGARARPCTCSTRRPTRST